jgi:hypothetical protein
MLSAEEEAGIEEFSCDENRCLLNTYFRDPAVDGICRVHFMPRKAHARYSEMTDSKYLGVG